MLVQSGLLVASLLVMTLGAEALVRGAVAVAKRFGVSSFFIGLTIVGFGTSTPELCTSLVAAWKGTGDIAVGNVVGSNIFNIFIVAGLTSTFYSVDYNVANNIDLGVMLLASVLLFGFMFSGKKPHTLQRWEGAFFVALYAAYTGFLVYRG